jgi:hypothetical protein
MSSLGAGAAVLACGEVAEFAGAVYPVACGFAADAELFCELEEDPPLLSLFEEREVENGDVAVVGVGVFAAFAFWRSTGACECICEEALLVFGGGKVVFVGEVVLPLVECFERLDDVGDDLVRADCAK